MKFSRSIITVCICLVALLSLNCSQDGHESGIERPSVSIHVPDLDERLLGPLGANPWFLVFLGLAAGAESADTQLPRLLDRWDHTPDYTQWTVHVREDVYWGDGVAVTAEDVKFSLEMWTNPQIGYEYPFFEEITVIDAHQLRITFNEPVSSTIFVFNWLVVLPKHLLEPLDLDNIFSWNFWIQPVGNGPYRYVRHVPGVMTELEANPDYYGEEPSVPKIVLRFGGNGLTELLSGNVDIATRIKPLQAVQIADDSRFRIYHKIKYMSHVGILWNHRNPLFQDADVRRALTLSIDRRELNQILNYPDDLPIFDVPATMRHHLKAMVPEAMPFAPKRAEKLLTEAGWVDTDNDGIREKDGQEFRFTLSTTEQTATEAVYIQAQYRHVGVHMDIGTYERSALWAKIRDPHDFDAAIHFNNHIETFGDFRYSGYKNAEISRLRDAIWYTIDQQASDRDLQALWRIVEAEIPFTYLHPELSYFAAHRRVKGLRNDIELYSAVEHLSIEDEE
jgi:peptide/nickel transport system substrate-binding protein